MWLWLILINHNYRKFDRTWQCFSEATERRKENEVWWLKHMQPQACGCWLNSCWTEPQVWSGSVAASSLQAGDHYEWRTCCLPHRIILAWLLFFLFIWSQSKQTNKWWCLLRRSVTDGGPPGNTTWSGQQKAILWIFGVIVVGIQHHLK